MNVIILLYLCLLFMLIGIIIVVLCFFGDARAKELAFPPVVHATYKTIAHQISEV